MIALFPLSQPATLAAVLEKLQPDTTPAWGRMNAQQMIEHLDGIVRHSASDEGTEILSPEETLPKLRRWLETDKPLPKDFMNPVYKDRPPAHPDLETAIRSLHEGLAHFHQVYDLHPEHTSPHPVFGYLDYEGWLRFHQKHFRHHLTQFGLLEE
ncbi:DUF1569 domain-containing protein [Chitinophaga barathri]|uniref:DUF1569 domain-containing protein n=1 Tax=Chitinophaga barathri TaxID=1647451 RepID=A0A3N4M6J6_9BACT|nr:DUF1569 domain-containing protein [Chitinophaga barathri]RPD38891.1 DUF1569 domain-containing protein [Chitinophaga barathri]